MKQVIVAVLFLVFTINVQASEYKIMGGAEIGQSEGEWDNYNADWENSFGVRLGVETKKTRIYASYNSFDTDIEKSSTDFESQTMVLNLEVKTEPKLKILRAFVGGHIGGIYSEVDTPWYTDDESSLMYGAQIGVLIDVLENLYFEIGYKYSWTTADNDTANPQELQSYYGAVNLKF